MLRGGSANWVGVCVCVSEKERKTLGPLVSHGFRCGISVVDELLEGYVRLLGHVSKPHVWRLSSLHDATHGTLVSERAQNFWRTTSSPNIDLFGRGPGEEDGFQARIRIDPCLRSSYSVQSRHILV